MNISKLIAVSSLFALAACTTEEPKVDDSNPVVESASAKLRVVHYGSDAPAVDVYVNGGLAVEGLEFEQGTDYLEVPAETTAVVVTAAGAGIDAPVLTVDGLELAEDVTYTAVAYGTLDNLAAAALVDSDDGLASSDIRVQVMHAAAAVGEVDIWAMGDTPTPLLTDVPFGAVGTLPDLPAGAYTVGIDVDNDAVPELVFDLPELAGGTSVNLFAVNDAQGTPFLSAQLPDGALARVDAVQFAQVRVLHLSPDAPPVDVFVDGGADPAVTDLAFTQGTGYLQVPAGPHDFAVSVAGSPEADAVLRVDGLELMGNQSYTAVAYNNVGDIGALALQDDVSGLADTDIRVQVTHAAPVVGDVDILNVTGGANGMLLEGVPFGATASLPDLPAGAYSVGIDADRDGEADLFFDLPALPGGTFVNLFATNDAGGAPFLLAYLPDGGTAEVSPRN